MSGPLGRFFFYSYQAWLLEGLFTDIDRALRGEGLWSFSC